MCRFGADCLSLFIVIGTNSHRSGRTRARPMSKPSMRIATALVALTVAGAAAAAERNVANSVPVCDGKFGLCRYVSKDTRDELLPARYERVMPFSEGLAAVRINGRFGYIDQRGEV